jgi:hypothetical protein
MGWYRIVSDAAGSPEMAGLRVARVDGPSAVGRSFYITFSTGYPQGSPYESAVGVRCLVIRHKEEQSWECGGAVLGVNPRVRVALDGTGWHPISSSDKPAVVGSLRLIPLEG